MAEMRCPMCGKSNPAEAESCRHCQARLRPLVIGSSGKGETAPKGNTGTTDWLKDLRSSAADGEDTAPENDSQPLEEAADWFSRLGGGEEPAKPAYSTPDWLSADTPTEGGDPNIPDWMEDLGIKNSPPEQEKSASDDWGLPGPSGQADDFGAGTSQGWPASGVSGEKEEPPDWLSGFAETPASEETPPAAPIPDWLNQFGGAEEPPASFETAEPASGLPDWLNQAAGQSDSAEKPAPMAGDVPDWLSQFGSEAETPAASADGLPDWFATAQSDGSAAAISPFGEDADLPPAVAAPGGDWFSGAASAAFGSLTSSEAEEAQEAQEPQGEQPSWISRLGAGAAQPASGNVSPFVMDEAESGAEAAPLSALPDWISQVSAEQSASDEAAGAAFTGAPAEDGLTPAMLPTWLEAMRPVEAAAPPTSMVDADAPIENAGPLAGLRGALPAEPEIASIRKPPVYSIKLQLSESHQARVNQLEDLLASEGRAEPLPARSAVAQQQVWRIAIFVLLVAVIIGVFNMQSEYTVPLPEQPLEEVSLVNGTINQLAEGAPVLVSFDYEPAQSGEMDAAVSTVLRHLIQRNTNIVLVSTSPNGALLSTRLLNDYNHYYDFGPQLEGKATTGWIAYETKEAAYHQYAQLGYIPGGLMGLRAFALSPQNTIPYALPDPADAIPNSISNTLSITDTLVWQQPAWKGIETIDQFSLVVVATDDANVARAWVEQTATVLGKGKLLMVISAQIEPLVRPYYENEPRQVGGYVAGLSNAASYDVLTTFQGVSRLYWNAFSAGLLTACVLILIGVGLNIVQLVQKTLNARKQ